MPLASDYYLKNLEKVLAVVLDGHRHLFAPEELERFNLFREASLPARRLYARLFLRLGPVFRLERLHYEEIPDKGSAAKELADRNLAVFPAEPAEEEDVPLFLAPFSMKDLSAAVPDLPRSFRRDQAVEWLLERSERWREVLDRSRLIVLCDVDLFSLLPLLFFGNRHQELSTLVIADIDQIRFPGYEHSRNSPFFRDRAALDDYLEAVSLSDEGVDELEVDELFRAGHAAVARLALWRPPEPFRAHLDAGRYRSRLAWQAARELQRQGDRTAARAIFLPLSRCGPIAGRVEAAVRLTTPARSVRLEQEDHEALGMLRDHPLLRDRERFLLEKRLSMVGKGPDPSLRLRAAKTIELVLEPAGRKGSKALYQLPDGEPATIEEAVLRHLCRDDRGMAGGLLAENRLYRTLFAYLFWDILFAKVPGAFQHPYQTAPMDLGSRYFRKARQDLIEERIESLTAKRILRLLSDNYGDHQGESCRLVAFEAYSLEDLLRAAAALGPALRGIMDRLANDPAGNGKGLPDLLFFRDLLREGNALLCEVKGPGDQPSVDQLLWHDQLLRLGLDVAIARVTTPATSPMSR